MKYEVFTNTLKKLVVSLSNYKNNMSKKLIFLFAFISLVSFANAQVPEGLNYQAVARDASGTLIKSQNINVRINIISGSTSGTLQWQETHAVTTNNFGLFTLVIGQGTSTGAGASSTF